jgi:regulator of chromosome condensation
VDAAESDANSEEGEDLNPHEASPAAISPEYFPPETHFVQVAAGDSCSFAVTSTGFGYGWGTFVSSKGDKCFGYVDNDGETTAQIQPTPVLVPGLKEVTQIACGANHAVALDRSGSVWAWGVDEQNQLGRPERSNFGRHKRDPLMPQRVRVCPGGARSVASGAYHSFAVDTRDVVWSIS